MELQLPTQIRRERLISFGEQPYPDTSKLLPSAFHPENGIENGIQIVAIAKNQIF